MMEPVIFGAFIALEVVFHNAPHWLEHTKHCAWVQQVSKNHYLVWLFHPSVMVGVQGYLVHFVVYSGKVIGGH